MKVERKHVVYTGAQTKEEISPFKCVLCLRIIPKDLLEIGPTLKGAPRLISILNKFVQAVNSCSAIRMPPASGLGRS